MFYTIYKTINTTNQMYYIGKHQTSNINDDYFGSGKYLKHAIKKYGKEKFKREILFVFDNELEMNNKERELVTENILNDPLSYNLCQGGKGGFGYINKNGLGISENQKKAAKKSKFRGAAEGLALKLKHDPIFREAYSAMRSKNAKEAHLNGKLSIAQLSTPQSIEKRKEIFKAIGHQKGAKNSRYGTCWITNGQENKSIPKIDLDKWVKLGYNKGRITK